MIEILIAILLLSFGVIYSSTAIIFIGLLALAYSAFSMFKPAKAVKSAKAEPAPTGGGTRHIMIQGPAPSSEIEIPPWELSSPLPKPIIPLPGVNMKVDPYKLVKDRDTLPFSDYGYRTPAERVLFNLPMFAKKKAFALTNPKEVEKEKEAYNKEEKK